MWKAREELWTFLDTYPKKSGIFWTPIPKSPYHGGMDRYLKHQVLQDLKEKMVLLAGPRQVGKTTLAKSLVKNYDYLNWDIDEDRTRLLQKEYQKAELWIFDEIHKFKSWRNYLKGLYDKLQNNQKILVTGSAKINELRKGGDSLQGRYHFLRLMPLSAAELKIANEKDLFDLYNLSGFPEPFFKGSKAACKRWSRAYQERIVRQEIASLEQFQDLAKIEILLHRLPEVIGGLLSINGLSEDIQVDHKTLAKWIFSLEKLYSVFRIPPFGGPKIKSIKKSQKLYFFDWNVVLDEGTRFENFIAVHILKWIYYEQDSAGRNLDLRFYRDKYDREVDFVILENNRPVHFIEAKLSDAPTGKGLVYLKSKYPSVRASQIHLKGQKDFVDGNGIEHGHCLKLLAELR